MNSSELEALCEGPPSMRLEDITVARCPPWRSAEKCLCMYGLISNVWHVSWWWESIERTIEKVSLE